MFVVQRAQTIGRFAAPSSQVSLTTLVGLSHACVKRLKAAAVSRHSYTGRICAALNTGSFVCVFRLISVDFSPKYFGNGVYDGLMHIVDVAPTLLSIARNESRVPTSDKRGTLDSAEGGTGMSCVRCFCSSNCCSAATRGRCRSMACAANSQRPITARIRSRVARNVRQHECGDWLRRKVEGLLCFSAPSV